MLLEGTRCILLLSFDQAVSLAFRYRLLNDTMRWLSVDKHTGSVQVTSSMDRESRYVTDNKYTVLVLAYDNGTFILVPL